MALVSWYPLIKNTNDYLFNNGSFPENDVVVSANGKIYQQNYTAISNIKKSFNISDLSNSNEITIIFWLKLSGSSTSENIFIANADKSGTSGSLSILCNGNTLTVNHSFFSALNVSLDTNYHQILIRIGKKMQIYVDKNLNTESNLTDVSRNYVYTGQSELYLGSFIIQDFVILNHYASDYEIEYYSEKPIIKYSFEDVFNKEISNEAIDYFNATGNISYSTDACKGTTSAVFTSGTNIITEDYPKISSFTILLWIKLDSDSSENIITFGNIAISHNGTQILINENIVGSASKDFCLLSFEYNNGTWKYSYDGADYTEVLILQYISDNTALTIGNFTGSLSEFQLIPNINIDVSDIWNVKATVDNTANFYTGCIECSGILINNLISGYIDTNGNITTSTEYPNAAYSNLYRVYSDTVYEYPTMASSYIEILEYDENMNYIERYPGINSGQYTTAENKFIRILFLNIEEFNTSSLYFYNQDNDYELNPILVNSKYTTMSASISENLDEAEPVFEVYKQNIKVKNIYEK